MGSVIGIGISVPINKMGGGSSAAAILLSASSQAENTSTNTTIGTLSVANGSGSYTFTETADPDNVFTVTGTSLKNSAVLNYEVATFHLVTIQADNGVDTPLTRQFTILVTDVNEAPVITSNGGGATAAISIAENTTAVTTVTATDVDAGAALTYSISGGADAALFQIGSSSGVLTFISAPDFEIPTDANADNDYVVVAQVSDGSLTDTQTVTVTVTDVGEGAGTLGSPIGLLLTLTKAA